MTQQPLGTNGHHYSHSIANEALHDRRVKVEHLGDTTNIRSPNGTRKTIKKGRSMKGTHFDNTRMCRTCNVIQPKFNFRDLTVLEKDQSCNSLNIHCRGCQTTKHTSGYVQDAFVVADEEEEDIDDEDEEEESEYEDDEDDEEESDVGDEEEEESEYEDDEEEESDVEDEDDEEESDEDESDVGEKKDDVDEEEFEVERICSHRLRKHTLEFEFLVQWLNYGEEHDSWEPYGELRHLTIVKNYIKQTIC